MKFLIVCLIFAFHAAENAYPNFSVSLLKETVFWPFKHVKFTGQGKIPSSAKPIEGGTSWYVFAGYFDKLISGEKKIIFSVSINGQAIEIPLTISNASLVANSEDSADMNQYLDFSFYCTPDSTFLIDCFKVEHDNGNFIARMKLSCQILPERLAKDGASPEKLVVNKDDWAKVVKANTEKRAAVAPAKTEGDKEKVAKEGEKKTTEVSPTSNEKEAAEKKPTDEKPTEEDKKTKDDATLTTAKPDEQKTIV